MKNCPECKTELREAKGIAIYCPNDKCPVEDDPDLWDGDGNRELGIILKLESQKIEDLLESAYQQGCKEQREIDASLVEKKCENWKVVNGITACMNIAQAIREQDDEG